ncbi:protein C1orf43 homolog isoform X4 [Enoplosus armatus]|uniref:protein C1orf43 homolog isoform X4 n=1 Tax=Enoplosus armatus TaxID=215367 RepID=UPI00399247E7
MADSSPLSGVNVVLVMAYGSLGLREEIDSRLSKVQEICFEPRLLSEEDDRLKQGSQISIPLQEISRSPSAFTGRNFRNWLLELRNSHSLIKSSRSALIDRLLEGYDSARHGTGVFGEAEFLEYQQALSELADVVKAYSSTTSLDQHHQSAAKDLTGSPVRGTPSTIQVTYLPSTGQRSKRPKHFLELKSFKDNYNTLESTL